MKGVGVRRSGSVTARTTVFAHRRTYRKAVMVGPPGGLASGGEEAADGHSALELLRSGRPRAAVIDVRMPGIDGLQVCARAAEERLPCSMIVKPFELSSLLADVRRAWGDG
jgi:DNA-binding NarL/FixJ family response regulator